jgi:RNA polymerase sporulation-specific sigma factor
VEKMIDILEHLGIARSLALQFHKNLDVRNKYELDDLFQIAYIGLLKAARKFVETKKVKFSTYAYMLVKYEITHTIRDDRFYPCKDRKQRIFSNVDSLDKNYSIFDNTKIKRVDTLTDNIDFTENIVLHLAVDKLSEEHKKIIQLRYYEGKSQVETAKILNLYQTKVYRLEKQALEQLKQYVS